VPLRGGRPFEPAPRPVPLPKPPVEELRCEVLPRSAPRLPASNILAIHLLRAFFDLEALILLGCCFFAPVPLPATGVSPVLDELAFFGLAFLALVFVGLAFFPSSTFRVTALATKDLLLTLLFWATFGVAFNLLVFLAMF
jgi:hypothetical protein